MQCTPDLAPLRPLALALCLIGISTAASGQDLVMADSPAKIVEIARGYGSAELETDGEGDPRIRARMEGTRYFIYFYGCSDGKDCKSIQFWSYFSAPANAYAAANDWNRNYRFGRAYVDDDGDIALEMDVNLWGGVTPKNLDDTFDWWRTIMGRAGETFEEGRARPGVAAPGSLDKTL